MTLTLRDASIGDAIEIAAVHVAAWRTTYTTLLPPEVVAKRTEMPARVELWRERLADPATRCIVVLADGVICGFLAYSAMPARPQGSEPLPDFAAYVHAFYVLASMQGRGVGRQLLGATADALLRDGHRTLALHVLATNPARAFYERMGAAWVRDDPVEPGTSWYQCVYGWRDITDMSSRSG